MLWLCHHPWCVCSFLLLLRLNDFLFRRGNCRLLKELRLWPCLLRLARCKCTEQIITERLQCASTQTLPEPFCVHSWYASIRGELEFLWSRFSAITDDNRSFGVQLFVIIRTCQICQFNVNQISADKFIPVPISVTAFVTWRSSIPENPVEFTVRPENPVDVSITELRCTQGLKAYR